MHLWDYRWEDEKNSVVRFFETEVFSPRHSAKGQLFARYSRFIGNGLLFATHAVQGATAAAAVAFLGLFLGLAPTVDHIPQHSDPQGQDQEQDYVRSQIHSFQFIVYELIVGGHSQLSTLNSPLSIQKKIDAIR